MVDVLEKLPLLHGLNRARLSELALAGTVREYKPGDVVVVAGDYADSVHVILAGQAGVQGRPQAAPLGPGDYFGEMALLDGGVRSATIFAVRNLRTLEVPRTAFIRLIRAEPGIALVMSAELSWRVRRLEADSRRPRLVERAPGGWPIPGLS
jgi:CRP/FNR family transcriptional regulator, cyclic AMP receptor protein